MAKKSRTREARQRRQKQRRQNQRLLLLFFIVAVAVVGVAVLVVSNQPVEAFIPDDLSARYDGIERSNSPKGYPRLGNADAPVTMEEYASFACPGCESFHSDSFDAVLERVKLGQVLFTYVPLNTGSIPNAPGASRAALCAGQQGRFWEMHDLLFDWQTRYGNTAFSQNRLLTGVEKLGLSSSAFTNCFNSA
ncbi:MAG: thioredoxin domain-containing protein, partial [Chloroflexi bacterium]|nr:thioredoxin domain-containing protein [Chloroflexota bacterium]